LKPAPFRYSRARSGPATGALLAGLGGGAKILAGGQSLVPVMNFRLARPDALAGSAGRLPLTPARVPELATNGGGR